MQRYRCLESHCLLQASNFVTIDKNLRRHFKIPRGLVYPLPIGQCLEILVCDWPSAKS